MPILADGVVASHLLRELLPFPGLAAYEICDFERAPPLHPDERLFIAKAAQRRIEEFTAGRACARRALADLGHPDFAVRVGADRGPIWPPGIVGSITHCNGFCGAVAVDESVCLGVGIDAERTGALNADEQDVFCTPIEREWLEQLEPDGRARAATLLFSAKEAFLKAQAPLTRRVPDFREIEIEVGRGVFRVRPNARHVREVNPNLLVHGRYKWKQDLVFCAIGLPAEGKKGIPND